MNNRKMKTFITKKRNDPNYYSEIKLSQIVKPITVLLGPNGTGKSMSIRNMKEVIKYNGDNRMFKDEIKNKERYYISYSTSGNDIIDSHGGPFGDFSPEALINAFRSEGERMTSSFFEWCNTSLLETLRNKNRKTLYVFIDEADSGLSWDRLRQHIPQINTVAKHEWKSGYKTHFIFTCNSYEMLENFQRDITDIIWVPTKEVLDIDSYDDFRMLYFDFYMEYYDD